jgi:hypothetical protein
MRANQLRLWFASMAYVLMCALRRIALQHTQFAQATCGTIRLKLFKIGALVRVSVRRIKVAGFRLSLPKRVRPRPFAPYRGGALTTQNRHRDNHPKSAHGRIAPAITRQGCAAARSPAFRVPPPPSPHIRDR